MTRAVDQSSTRRRSWNGCGLSQWRCACGAARRVTGFLIRGEERIAEVYADPCKRCGSTAEPECIGDPWLDVGETA
jgi:hypothetical protein